MPRGATAKQERQYKDIKASAKKRGASTGRATELAARTVNKNRARAGQTRTASRSSTHDMSPQKRGGLRSGKPGPRGRTKEQLYNEARQRGIAGRSSMNKAQLERALSR